MELEELVMLVQVLVDLAAMVVLHLQVDLVSLVQLLMLLVAEEDHGSYFLMNPAKKINKKNPSIK